MLFRRDSFSDNLGIILGTVIPLTGILIVLAILFVRRKTQRKTRSRAKKPIPLPLHIGAFDVPGVPESACSYASTFTFPQSKERTPTDLKQPFRFPSSASSLTPTFDLPTLPPQAVVVTAHRAYAAPPPRKINMSKSTASITIDDIEPSLTATAPADDKAGQDGWGLSYYEEDHPPFTRPPSYSRTPSRPRSHSPLSIPLRSASLRQPKTLSRRPSTPTLLRRLSQPLDITISTEVRVHIDSMYVESHRDDLHKDRKTTPMQDGLVPRITSIVPQIPSMHIPSLYFGTSFDTFGEIGNTLIALDKSEENRRSQTVTLGSTIDENQTVITVPNSPNVSIGDVPDTGSNIKPLASAARDNRRVPVGWI